MKAFIGRIFIFFVIVAFVDFLIGSAMGSITKKIDIGGLGRDNFICDKVTDDIVILGSSRAEQHYNSQMISDSLGVSCYNAGESSCGIILAYGRLLMLSERYTPQTIIYEITPEYDYLAEAGGDYHIDLSRLKQHYEREGIDSIFWDIDYSERYKMLSGAYRHNSTFLQNLVVYYCGVSSNTGVKGFRPNIGNLDLMKVDENRIVYDSSKGYKCDSLKIKYLNKFIDETQRRKIDLIFVMSPMWYSVDTTVLVPIKNICADKNIKLLNFTNDSKYLHNNSLFWDGKHLNQYGADEFTQDLIHELINSY